MKQSILYHVRVKITIMLHKYFIVFCMACDIFHTPANLASMCRGKCFTMDSIRDNPTWKSRKQEGRQDDSEIVPSTLYINCSIKNF